MLAAVGQINLNTMACKYDYASPLGTGSRTDGLGHPARSGLRDT